MPEMQSRSLDEIEADRDNLWREEYFTDLQVATVRRLTPVNPDGSVDGSRKPVFIGQTTIVTEAGPVPVQARLEGETLSDALDKFPEAIKKAVSQMVQEIRDLQRQASSRIVVPKGMPPGGLGGQGGPKGGPAGPQGGPGGPGGIQLP
ncbi:MAG: hypothetical protein ACODAJ_11140 [Planctomycetota bacterium]